MKIAIMGFGRMGSWLTDELRTHHQLAVYDKNWSQIPAEGVLRLTRLEELAVFSPRLLVNAVTLKNTIHAFLEVEPFLPEDCILADMASIKGNLADYYQNSRFRWASLHPMFGPSFADTGNLRNENGIIIQESDPEAVSLFTALFHRLKLKVHHYTFAQHDHLMAYSLTLPFVASLVFAACLDERTVPGTTFSKHREIAEGLLGEDDSLLTEILFNPFSINQLELLTGRLEFLKHIIRGRDSEEAKQFIQDLRHNLNLNQALD